MQIFEYPYVIITILVAVFILMGLIGLYFTMKSVKTAKGTAEKSFCGIGKIESDFEKAGALRQNRSVIYVSVSLDGMKRLYSEAKAQRTYEQIKKIVFRVLCLGTGGEISTYGNENFVALTSLDPEKTEECIEKCFGDINDALAKQGAVNVVVFKFSCLSVKVTKLIKCRILCQQIALFVTVFFLQHHRICRLQRVLIASVKELVECPTHILLMGGKFFFFPMTLHKSSNVLTDKIGTQILSYSGFGDTEHLCRMSYHLISLLLVIYNRHSRSNH